MENIKEEFNKLIDKAYYNCVTMIREYGNSLIENEKKYIPFRYYSSSGKIFKLTNSKVSCLYVKGKLSSSILLFNHLGLISEETIAVLVNYIAIEESTDKIFISKDSVNWYPLNDSFILNNERMYPMPADVIDVHEAMARECTFIKYLLNDEWATT